MSYYYVTVLWCLHLVSKSVPFLGQLLAVSLKVQPFATVVIRLSVTDVLWLTGRAYGKTFTRVISHVGVELGDAKV